MSIEVAKVLIQRPADGLPFDSQLDANGEEGIVEEGDTSAAREGLKHLINQKLTELLWKGKGGLDFDWPMGGPIHGLNRISLQGVKMLEPIDEHSHDLMLQIDIGEILQGLACDELTLQKNALFHCLEGGLLLLLKGLIAELPSFLHLSAQASELIQPLRLHLGIGLSKELLMMRFKIAEEGLLTFHIPLGSLLELLSLLDIVPDSIPTLSNHTADWIIEDPPKQHDKKQEIKDLGGNDKPVNKHIKAL